MEIRLSVFETLLLMASCLFGGVILLATINGEMENGFIYFGLAIFAVGNLVMRRRVRKRKP